MATEYSNPTYAARYVDPNAAAIARTRNQGDPIHRLTFEQELLPSNEIEWARAYQMGQFRDTSGENIVGPTAQESERDATARKMLALYDQYGATTSADLPPEVRQQMPYQGTYRGAGDTTFGRQFADFVTSPAFLVAAGGLGAMYAAPATAAGAGSGATGGGVTGALGETAFGGSAAYGGTGATAAGTAAGSTGGFDWSTAMADSGTTMTDVSPGMFGGGGEAAATGLGEEAMFSTGSFGSGAPAAGGSASPGLGGFTGGTAAGGYKFPYENVVGGLLSSYLAKGRAKDLQGAIGQAADRADPFYAERPRYQEQFRGLTSSPSGFFQDPAIQDIINFQTGATERRLAGQGYNMSGNFADEVSRTGMREAFGQYMPYSRMIGEAAGAFQGTQGAGSILGQGAEAVNTATGQAQAPWGTILGDIFRGQQPNAAQQAQGTPKNQSLYESVFL